MVSMQMDGSLAVWFHLREGRVIVGGDTMKVGDLVINEYEPDRIGLIINQVGFVDRWVVLWPNGSFEAFWYNDLEVISGSR